EERGQAQADAVARLEVFLAPRPQRHDRGRGDLVDGRQRGGGALRLDQPLRGCAAAARHTDPFLALPVPRLEWWRGGAPTGRGFGRLGGFFGGRLELRGRFRQARLLGRRGGGEVALDIFLDDPAMHAAALHLRQIDAFLLGQLSRDGRHTARPFRLRFGVCFGGCRFLGGRGRRGLFGGGSRFLPGGRSRLINDP